MKRPTRYSTVRCNSAHDPFTRPCVYVIKSKLLGVAAFWCCVPSSSQKNTRVRKFRRVFLPFFSMSPRDLRAPPAHTTTKTGMPLTPPERRRVTIVEKRKLQYVQQHNTMVMNTTPHPTNWLQGNHTGICMYTYITNKTTVPPPQDLFHPVHGKKKSGISSNWLIQHVSKAYCLPPPPPPPLPRFALFQARSSHASCRRPAATQMPTRRDPRSRVRAGTARTRA